QLEVLSSPGTRDLTQGIAVENRADRRTKPGRVGNDSAAGRADSDHIHWRIPLTRCYQSSRDIAAPGLPVGHDDEGSGILGLAVDFLVLFDKFQSPIKTFLDIRVPGRVFFEPEWGTIPEVIEEKEQRVGITGQPYLRGRDVRKKC